MAEKFKPLDADQTNVITPVFRLSYPHVWEPHFNTLAKRKEFNITMLFDKKTATADLKAMYDVMRKVAAHRFGNNIKGLKNPFKDGDTATNQAGELLKEKNPSYAGNIVLQAWSKNQPGIVNGKKQIIINQDEVYGGCYCRAQLNCYAYETGGNRGISFGLNNIQKVKDGDPFGSRARPEDAFTEIEGQESLAEDQPALEASDSMFSS